MQGNRISYIHSFGRPFVPGKNVCWLCIECVLHMRTRARHFTLTQQLNDCVFVATIDFRVFSLLRISFLYLYIFISHNRVVFSFQYERCSFVSTVTRFVVFFSLASIQNAYVHSVSHIQGHRLQNDRELHTSAVVVVLFFFFFYSHSVSRIRDSIYYLQSSEASHCK